MGGIRDSGRGASGEARNVEQRVYAAVVERRRDYGRIFILQRIVRCSKGLADSRILPLPLRDTGQILGGNYARVFMTCVA
jgi:hypothetical protein